VITLLAILVMAGLGYRHGEDMHALGRKLGRTEGAFDAERRRVDREHRTRPSLRVVK
jgi:hypothetical protein